MKNLLFVAGFVLFWAGCQKSNTEISSDVTESRARIVNNLAVDGCDWHFEIANTDSSTIATLIPTLASEAKVKAAVPKYGTQDAYSFINVIIKYRMAGTKRNLTCGFGHVSPTDEIEIVEIRQVD